MEWCNMQNYRKLFNQAISTKDPDEIFGFIEDYFDYLKENEDDFLEMLYENTTLEDLKTDSRYRGFKTISNRLVELAQLINSSDKYEYINLVELNLGNHIFISELSKDEFWNKDVFRYHEVNENINLLEYCLVSGLKQSCSEILKNDVYIIDTNKPTFRNYLFENRVWSYFDSLTYSLVILRDIFVNKPYIESMYTLLSENDEDAENYSKYINEENYNIPIYKNLKPIDFAYLYANSRLLEFCLDIEEKINKSIDWY